jgi:hypothetical protein
MRILNSIFQQLAPKTTAEVPREPLKPLSRPTSKPKNPIVHQNGASSHLPTSMHVKSCNRWWWYVCCLGCVSHTCPRNSSKGTPRAESLSQVPLETHQQARESNGTLKSSLQLPSNSGVEPSSFTVLLRQG